MTKRLIQAARAVRAVRAARASCAALALLALASCSSAPKRPPEIFTNRNAAIAQLDLGNQTVSKGDYASAHLFLQEAWRLAVSTDDPETRIRVLLAEGNALFNEGKRAEADAVWAKALSEAEAANLKVLVSTTRIYRARSILAEGLPADSVGKDERALKAQEAKSIAVKEIANVRSNGLYTAFAYKVIGLSDKELGNFAEAEVALRKAATIHENGRYLEDAAYDWYLIASVRSRSGNYQGAAAALQTALGFDRRAENANGLGMNWMALGTVELKAGNREGADAAWARAEEIFRSAFLTRNADEVAKKRTELAGKDTPRQ